MGKPLRYDPEVINKVLTYTRTEIQNKIRHYISSKQQEEGSYSPLYDLTLDYPFRKGKMLRPALCISVARAMGGLGEFAVTIAAALELYHNAFLIKDDFEDESDTRRGSDTLYKKLGIPRAMNVGDATNVLAVGMIMENLSILGAGKTLHILQEIELMARQSVEGQAMELDWRYFNTYGLNDEDYADMCVKKTCWYTFMSPARIGFIAGYSPLVSKDFMKELNSLSEMTKYLGLAFQIQDDILNIQGSFEKYGKETAGDIFEGKRTILLNHVIKNSAANNKIVEIINKNREEKTAKEVEYILQEMKKYGSIEYAKNLAAEYAHKAIQLLSKLKFINNKTSQRPHETWQMEYADKRFVKEVINYVIQRNH